MKIWILEKETETGWDEENILETVAVFSDKPTEVELSEALLLERYSAENSNKIAKAILAEGFWDGGGGWSPKCHYELAELPYFKVKVKK